MVVMGTALESLRDFLKRKRLKLDLKTTTSLLVLVLLLILLPVGIFLIRNQLNLAPRAAGELIQLGEGGCIKLNKDKKKVVDCPLVPLKLINPFFSGSSAQPSVNPSNGSTASSSPNASIPGASTSPSPSFAGTPQIVRVTGNTSSEINAALDQIKSTGGAVYLPAGNYVINTKVELNSNTTLFGDGIDQTILTGGINIDEEEAVVGNDTDEGNNNIVIRDLTIKGHPQGSGEAIKLRNLDGGFITNVKVQDTNTGILLGFHSGKGVNNVRVSNCQVINTKIHGIFVTLGENNVIDHCNVNSGGSDSLGIGLEIGVDGKISENRVISNTITGGGHSMSFTAGNDNQYEDGWVNSSNIACYNSASGNHIDPIWDQRGRNNLYVGNSMGVSNVGSFGYTEKGGTDPSCEIPAKYNIPPAPGKPAADASSIIDRIVGTVFAQDSDDKFVDGEDNDSNDQFTLGSATPTASATLNPTGSSGSAKIGVQSINTTYTLKDTKVGPKQIWVEYRHPDGTTRRDHVTFDLVDKTPQILGLSCTLDVSKQNLKITVNGNYFGNDIGIASTVSPDNKIDVLSWNKNEVIGTLKSPRIPTDGQRFRVKVVRPDGFESGVAVCAVNKSLISLGAKLFCREPGKFDASDVAVTLLYNPDASNPNAIPSKVEEKVTISKDGEIDNLKSQLQVGKNYAISIKAPNSLRRTAVFTALEGTTEILRPDGTPFILPIGDIAPKINLDGQINTLDRAELIRQWRILGQDTVKQTGDFNRDSKVNSIDWACMQYDFGSSDEPIPTEIPGAASGTIHIPNTISDTLFIPASSSSPSPSPSSVSLLLQNEKILLIS